jgi:hypothetical protein
MISLGVFRKLCQQKKNPLSDFLNCKTHYLVR